MNQELQPKDSWNWLSKSGPIFQTQEKYFKLEIQSRKGVDGVYLNQANFGLDFGVHLTTPETTIPSKETSTPGSIGSG